MSFELEPHDMLTISPSSSTYSEDFITTVSSTGTLVHHRSHLRPLDGGTPHPYYEIRDRILGPSSSFSLVHDGEVDPNDPPGIDWTFETFEEAEERRRWSATLSRADTPRSFRSPAEHAFPEAPPAPLIEIDFKDIGPRPPIPPRRRPTIHGLNNRHSIASHHSTMSSWVTTTDDRMSAECARGNNQVIQVTPLRAIHSADGIRHIRDASHYMLPPTNMRLFRSVRQAPRGYRGQQTGRSQPIHALGRTSLTDSSSDPREEDMDEFLSLREALSSRTPVQHRVATDCYGSVVIDTIVEQSEEPTELISDHVPSKVIRATGYVNGDYVTDLQSKKPTTKVKSRKVIRRIFCS
ncbi:hypothetical protein DE146DRAFT_627647 [Phaeosphaeria sp. MPI-PUGE-AT-0046c]|nr:hypothetical protein DE146DRAFT_627647 [Phaeosphaeria sp. MPI-PUGE-AT-0046c]